MQYLPGDQEKVDLKETELADEEPSAVLENDEDPIGESSEDWKTKKHTKNTQFSRNTIRFELPDTLLKAGSDLQTSNVSIGASAPDDEWEYLTGLKLTTVVSLLSIAAFIIWLDTSIVATVSFHLEPRNDC